MSGKSYLPSPGLVVACVALLLVLGGTGGAAVSQAPPKNSVGAAQLKSNAVTTPKIKNNAVVAAKIASNAVGAAKIASNAVTGPKIAANAVTSEKVQDGSIGAADLAAGVLPTSTALGRSRERACRRRVDSGHRRQPHDPQLPETTWCGRRHTRRQRCSPEPSPVGSKQGPTSTRPRRTSPPTSRRRSP